MTFCALSRRGATKTARSGARKPGTGKRKKASSIPCSGGVKATSGFIARCSARFDCLRSGRFTRATPKLPRMRSGWGASCRPRRSFIALLMELRLGRQRSEEHTSELQSLTNLVCRLLLEKKKKKSDDTEFA